MSEIERIGEILPEVLRDIRKRCELNLHNRDFNPTLREHRKGVVSAVGDFMFRKSKRPKRDKKRQRVGQGKLW